MAQIVAAEANARRNKGWGFIDIRDLSSFTLVHVPGAVCIPFSMTTARNKRASSIFLEAVSRKFQKTDKIVVIDENGSLSTFAVLRLSAAGYKHLRIVYAGMNAWLCCSRLPVVRRE